MRCPNCGTHNGKTNKYCRDCGTRLEVLAPKEDKQEAAASRRDELTLGEELFGVHELLETGDLEAALEKGAKLATDNPDSASAHAIVAMVCERMSENFAAEADPLRAKEFLKLAIDRYETVIDLNPDSAADREKLASLRLRYTGQVVEMPVIEPEPERTKWFNKVSAPVLASGAAFIVLITLVIALTSSPKAKPENQTVQQPVEPPTPSVAQQPLQPPQSPQPPMSVYTYPATSSVSQPPQVSEPVQQAPRLPQIPAQTEVRPANVPRIDQELTLVPEAKPSAPTKPEPAPKQQAEEVKTVSSAPIGDSQLAEAIKLGDQRRYSEAINAANRAIAMYQIDIESEKSVEQARRGITNARNLISTWRQYVNAGNE